MHENSVPGRVFGYGNSEYRFGSARLGRNFELKGLTRCNSRLGVVTVLLTADLESTSNSGSYRVLLGIFGYPSTQVTGQFQSK